MQVTPRPPSARDESGQTIILFVFAMVAIIGFTALVVDVGQGYVEKRGAQNAADAAALAAAASLPEDSAAAVLAAKNYLRLNGMDPDSPKNTVTITTPYKGDPTKVEVTITHNLNATFGRVLGIDNFDVHARAVGGRGPEANYALFQTDDPGCDEELELHGEPVFIDGGVYAEGVLDMKAKIGEVTGAATYFCDLKPPDPTFTVGFGPEQLPAPLPRPVNYVFSDFVRPCDFSYSNLKITVSGTPELFQSFSPKVLKPGVYCSQDDIEMLENDVTANGVVFIAQDRVRIAGGQFTATITMVAHDDIEICCTGSANGDNFNLKPFLFDVLAFTDGIVDGDFSGGDDKGEIDFDGDDGTFEGMLLAPFGEVELDGHNMTSPATFVMGKEVEVHGDNISLTAMPGVAISPGFLSLIE